METLLHWVSVYGAPSLAILLMLGIVGLPVPDETLLVFSGYLIFSGQMHPVATFGFALAGSVCGITVSYWLGRTWGHEVLLKYGKWFHLTADRIHRVHEWFERIGRWALLAGYYIPGVRHFTAVVAGSSELEWPVFAAFAYTGALLWVSTFLSLGYFLGENWQKAWETIHSNLHLAGYAVLGLALTTWGVRWIWMRRSARGGA
jgi:membrane protein DedA with SNARE-associated domain